jgi:hypothetical protein
LTSRAGSERAWASVEAVVAELPLAFFSFWVARDASALEAVARRPAAARRADVSASSRAP